MLFSAFLFSLSSNLDNLVIGSAYGIRKIKFGLIPNLLIAVITSVGTYLSMALGNTLSSFLSPSLANTLGAAAMGLLALYFIAQSLLKLFKKSNAQELALKDIAEMEEYAQKSDQNSNGQIEPKEALAVSVGLLLNNLGMGITASITNVNALATSIFTFIFSFLFLKIGQKIGSCSGGKFFGNFAPLFSGILLLLLAVLEFLH